jgi:methionine synthase I (cobalamin-dependent)
MTITLRQRISDDRVHVMDGAMGTALYAKGMFVNVCYDELNLTTSTCAPAPRSSRPTRSARIR